MKAGDRVVTRSGVGRYEGDGNVFIEHPRPRGAYLVEEIEAQYLADVRVWLGDHPLRDGHRVIAHPWTVVPWAVAVEHGLVRPPSRAELSETRGGR